MTSAPYTWLDSALDTIDRAGWYRSVRSIAGRAGAEITLDGQNVVNFASNDYLGLAGDDRQIGRAHV